MRRADWVLLLMASAFLTSVVGQTACARPAPPAAETTTGGAVPVGTVKEIMKGIVDPSSKVIWDAVGTASTEKGLVETAPRTDEEWAVVEHNALMLAEVANLLKMPGRPMARPEEMNAKSQPDAPELTPTQMEAKIGQDRAAWNTRADALQQTAVKAIAAARAHDTNAVLSVGEEIDNACESCHVVYWYPDEKKS
jgi:hypothetical protein